MRYIIILTAIISVILYYGIGELLWQLKNPAVRLRFKRLVTGVLIVALLASQLDIMSLFTKTAFAAETENAEIITISDFIELPAEIREQTVPVGTTLNELVLPDTLEAVCVALDVDTDAGEGTDTDEDADTDAGEDTDTNGDTDTDTDIDASNDTETNADTYTDTDVIPDNDRLGDIDDTEGDTEKVETFSVIMPEYRTGNVIEVKTLEMAPAANYGSIEETIIIENIAWQSEQEYDGDTEGEYIFTAILPQGYVLTNRVNTPQITVTVGGTDDTALLSGDGIMPIAEHTHDGITFTAWTDTISPPTSSGNYYLEYDINGAGHELSENKNINLCLNGHTINTTTTPGFRVYGTLNIYDCQGDGKVTNSAGNVLSIQTNGTANIYGGTFSNSTANPPIYVEGTVTIENASVYGTDANAVAIGSGGMATINGGTFETTVDSSTIYPPTIDVRADSSLKITGGTFIHNDGSNVIQNQGTLEMSGGTVTGTSTGDRGVVGILNYGGEATIKNVTVITEGTVADGDTADKGLRNDNGGTMTVENCNVTSTNRAVWNTGTDGSTTIKISSGTFSGRYGIYNNNGKFELSGSPTFAGSTADIYLSNNQKITVIDTLGNAAPYSVLTQTNPASDSPVVITDSSTTSYNVAAKFTAADSRYAVSKNNSGQLELAVIPHTHNGITFEPWTDTETLPTSGSYYLEDDVTLDRQCELSDNANTTLNLCLDGHTITYPLWNPPIWVGSSNTLNIYDCQDNGKVTTNDSNTLYIASGGTANIYGGTFVNPTTSPNIAILGTVTIYGGTFESTNGVTISVQPNASLKIIDGTFIRNNGGNVIQNQGTLEMSGGTVTGKSTSTSGAVGIVNSGTSATATIKNVTVITEGTVANNDTEADKGLRNDNGGTMTVENCNVTSTNRAVWNTGGATIKISGGTFNGRYGIYNNNGKFELSGSPTFAGSVADIYLSNNQKITVTGTLGNAAPYSVLTQTNPTAGSPVVITDSSTTSYNVAAKFTAANNSYIVRKNSSGQLELAVPATYTITYDKGTGSDITGSVLSGTKTEGVDFMLSSQTFTRTGYTQTGWSKNSNGSTKDYALGAIYTDDASITLYPYWVEGTAPPQTDGGSTGGNSGGSSSGSGNDSQSSDNNSGGSPSEDSPSASPTPSTDTTPPTVETVMPDTDGGQRESSVRQAETDTASPVETEPVTEPQKEQTEDTQTDTTAPTAKEGTVRVTVVSDGYQYAAGVTDTAAVADAVLTPEQIQLVNGGESIEIRVEVTDISNKVSQQDRDIIEGGLADYKVTGDMDGEGELTLGAYIDISMYIRIGDGDWDAITQAGEPIEIVIGIPDDLLSDGLTYYIARSHEGDFVLLNDLDSEPDTITIKTELFSTYAIVYHQTLGVNTAGSRCSLCHICPTFLGICYFVWLAIILVVACVVFFVIYRMRKEKELKIS